MTNTNHDKFIIYDVMTKLLEKEIQKWSDSIKVTDENINNKRLDFFRFVLSTDIEIQITRLTPNDFLELETIGDEFYMLIEDTMVFLSNILMNIYELSQNSIKSFKCLKENCKNVNNILPPPSPKESSEFISINKNVEEIDDDIIEITPDNYASVEKKNTKKDSTLNQMLNSDKNTITPITMFSGTSSNSATRASINMPKSKKANFRSNKITSKTSVETTDLATESQLKKRLRSQAKLNIEKQLLIEDSVDKSKLTVHVFGLLTKKGLVNKKMIESLLVGIPFEKIEVQNKSATIKFTNEDAARRAARKLTVIKPKCIISFGTQFNELKKKYENKQAQLKSRDLKRTVDTHDSKNISKTINEDLNRCIDSVVESSKVYPQTSLPVLSATSVISTIETPPLSRSESTNSSNDIFNSNKLKKKDSFTCFSTSLYVFGINKATKESDLWNLFKDFKIDKIELKSELDFESDSFAVLKFCERDQNEAQKAIDFGNGKYFQGKFIVVGFNYEYTKLREMYHQSLAGESLFILENRRHALASHDSGKETHSSVEKSIAGQPKSQLNTNVTENCNFSETSSNSFKEKPTKLVSNDYISSIQIITKTSKKSNQSECNSKIKNSCLIANFDARPILESLIQTKPTQLFGNQAIEKKSSDQTITNTGPSSLNTNKMCDSSAKNKDESKQTSLINSIFDSLKCKISNDSKDNKGISQNKIVGCDFVLTIDDSSKSNDKNMPIDINNYDSGLLKLQNKTSNEINHENSLDSHVLNNDCRIQLTPHNNDPTGNNIYTPLNNDAKKPSDAVTISENNLNNECNQNELESIDTNNVTFSVSILNNTNKGNQKSTNSGSQSNVSTPILEIFRHNSPPPLNYGCSSIFG